MKKRFYLHSYHALFVVLFSMVFNFPAFSDKVSSSASQKTNSATVSTSTPASAGGKSSASSSASLQPRLQFKSIQDVILWGEKLTPAQRARVNALRVSGLKMTQDILRLPDVFPKLRVLSLQGGKRYKLGDVEAQVLEVILPRLPNLTELSLAENRLGGDTIQILDRVLPQGLVALNLAGNRIGSDSVQILALLLGKLSSLEKLNLSRNRLGVVGVKNFRILEEDVRRSTYDFKTRAYLYRTKVDLSGNESTAVVDKPSAEENSARTPSYLASFAALNHLLENVSLAQMLRRTTAPSSEIQARVTALDLSKEEEVTPEMIRRIPEYFPNLNGFTLRKGGMGEPLVQALAQALSQLLYLVTLDLSGNKMGADAAQILAPAFPASLTTLNLAGNNMGADGTWSFIQALNRLTKLTKLNLAGNNMGPQNGSFLARNLFYLAYLEILDISGNNIGDSGAETLASALLNLRNLNELILRNNNIGRDGARALARNIARLTNLKRIDFSQNLVRLQ